MTLSCSTSSSSSVSGGDFCKRIDQILQKFRIVRKNIYWIIYFKEVHTFGTLCLFKRRDKTNLTSTVTVVLLEKTKINLSKKCLILHMSEDSQNLLVQDLFGPGLAEKKPTPVTECACTS